MPLRDWLPRQSSMDKPSVLFLSTLSLSMFPNIPHRKSLHWYSVQIPRLLLFEAYRILPVPQEPHLSAPARYSPFP